MAKKDLSILFLCFLAVSFVLYGNSIGGDFIYDDTYFSGRSELREAGHLLKLWFEPYLAGNPDAGAYRPFAIFSFSLNFLFFGDSPASFHVINIILNAVAVFLVFILVFKLFNNKSLAIFSALLFAFLPIHTEAVASIKSRDEILAAIFALLAWLVFIRSTNERTGYKGILLSSFLFLLAVLSKETFILSPLIFLAVLFVQKRPSFKYIFDLALLFTPAFLVYFLMRIKSLGIYAFGASQDDFTTNPLLLADSWERIWTPFKAVFIYISRTFAPVDLSASYHFNQIPLVGNPFDSIQAILGIVFLALLVLLVLMRKIRITPLGAGALIFLISYITISKFIFQAADLVAERWMYFPSVGLSLIGGFIIYKIYGIKKEAGILFLIFILIIYGAVTITRNNVWLTSDSIFSSMIEDAPDSVQGYLMLSVLNLRHEPISEMENWIDNLYRIAPGYMKTLNLKGLLEGDKGNFGLAEEYFLKAIEADPQARPIVERNMAVLYRVSATFYAQKGRYDDSIRQLLKLRKILSDSWQSYSLLGQAYILKKDYVQARLNIEKAVLLNPDDEKLKDLLKIL